MARVLLLLFALLTLGLSAGPSLGQERLPRINPLTGKPYGPKAIAEYEAEMKRLEAEDEAVRQASEESERRWEEARARNAEQIKAFDDAVEDWQEANPAPAGTREALVHTSYDNDTALAEGADITYFNRWDIPTHKVSFGPDGRPTGPVTQTQQGKAWETLGPRIPPGGGVEIAYGEDFEGNEIITEAHIFGANGRQLQSYEFNFDGVPWRGETRDPETGLRNGGFEDPRFKPPPRTLGGPLPVPTQVRFITGVCERCRPLMNQHNDLAHRINSIIIEMKALSEQHQHAYPPAQRPIRMRYDVLEKELAALMPEFEQVRATVIECDRVCRLADAPSDSIFAAGQPGAPPLVAPQGPGAFALAGAAEQPVQPTASALPADNADLDAIVAAAQAYLAAANCDGMVCPVCDCDAAREAVQALSDMEQYLTAMMPYLEAAQADHLALVTDHARNNITSGEQQARTIWAIGVHQALHNFGSALLDIASVAGWAKEIATGEKALDELSPAEFLDRINNFYQAAKDLESLTATLSEAQTGKPANTGIGDLVDVAGGVDKDFINNTTSTLTDIKSIVNAALEHGKDWRKALKEGGAMAALGQIAGRYLKSYSAEVLQGRQQALDELLKDAGAGDIAQSQAYLALVAAQTRRWAAEDALVAVRAARRAYTLCAYEACGPFTITRPVIPTFRLDVPGGQPKLAWGQALRWFNGAIARTLPRLKPVPFRDDCPGQEQDDPRAAADTPALQPEPCPPKLGRDPITVGPNSKVGSGAQLRSKIGGMATGALMGALGVGGGGGGSDGPDLWTCKIKDSEYTVFNDPVTGVSLGVAARTVKGGKTVLFAKIMKSPDKGTFQTAFLERPSTGETIAPSDVGPCDLWGEWKLTVSWTRSTYVDGQLVSQESGGWSEGGRFRIPGMLSKVDAPDGLWKRMGFSNASNGAREMGAIFDVQPGGEPLTLVVHVTRPKGDPVTTVPFVLTLTQGADGKIAVAKAAEAPCPEDSLPVGPPVALSPPGTATSTTAPPPESGPASLPRPNTDPGRALHTGDLKTLINGLATIRAKDLANRRALEAARCEGPEAWGAKRDAYLKELRGWLEIVQQVVPIGKDAAAIQTALDGEKVRLAEEILEVEALPPPPPPTVCPPGEDTEPDSILDQIDEVFVPA